MKGFAVQNEVGWNHDNIVPYITIVVYGAFLFAGSNEMKKEKESKHENYIKRWLSERV